MLSPSASVVGSTGLGDGRSPLAMAAASSGVTVSSYLVCVPRSPCSVPPAAAPLDSPCPTSCSFVEIESFCHGQPLASSVVGVRSTLVSPDTCTPTPVLPLGRHVAFGLRLSAVQVTVIEPGNGSLRNRRPRPMGGPSTISGPLYVPPPLR